MYPKTEQKIRELVQNKKIPGISYAFISKEKVEKNIIGFKQLLPEEIKLEEETLYDMASLTKVICTTTIILRLVEEKILVVDEPLASYLPEFLDENVTIRELLTHTSDIKGYIPNRDSLNQSELRKEILKLKSGENRGKVVQYTDTGTVLLGFLIENLYQKSVHDVFREEVLSPLEMISSGFSEITKSLAAPTEVTKSRGVIQGEVHDPKAFVLGEHCGSAGLFANVSDTLNFVQMYLERGTFKDKRLLKEETILNLLTDQTQGFDKPRSLGWDLLSCENRSLLFHTGYTGTFIIIDILSKEAFIFLSNRVHPVDNRLEYLVLRDELIQIYLKERQN